MALALDGSVHGNSGSSASLGVVLTTTAAGIIYVAITTNGGPVTGVSDTAGLTYAQRASASAGGSNVIETWYAVSAGAHASNTITVTTTSSAFLTIDAFGVSGSDVSTIWDGHAGIPVTAGGAAPVTPLSITTSNANDFIIGAMREGNRGSPSANTGWSLISGADFQLVEYLIVSATQTALGVQEATVDANAANGAIADAIMQSSGGSNVTVTPGVINLTLTTFAPQVNLTVIPPTTALTLTTFAPVKGDGVVPATLALSTATFAPQVNLTVIPPTTALTLTTFAPDIGGSSTVTPDTLALTLTVFAPTVTASTPTPTIITTPAPLGGGGRHHRQGWLARESWPREEAPEEIGPDLEAMQREIAELQRYWQLKSKALKGDIELIEQAVILLAGILND